MVRPWPHWPRRRKPPWRATARRRCAITSRHGTVKLKHLRRQLWVALPIALLSFALLLVTLTGVLLPDHPHLQGVLIVVTLFAASLALFDVLTGIFFGWVPYAMDNRGSSAGQPENQHRGAAMIDPHSETSGTPPISRIRAEGL